MFVNELHINILPNLTCHLPVLTLNISGRERNIVTNIFLNLVLTTSI